MDLTVLRRPARDNAILGDLIIDGRWECFTLERADKAIPAGRYRVTLYHSPHFGRLVPLLQNVPGRDYIEMHVANDEHQLLGCIAVGTQIDGVDLDHSQAAFDHFEPQLEAVIDTDPIWITIEDPTASEMDPA